LSCSAFFVFCFAKIACPKKQLFFFTAEKISENSFCHSPGSENKSHNAMRVYEVRRRKDNPASI
jgi:hypothetical protein